MHTTVAHVVIKVGVTSVVRIVFKVRSVSAVFVKTFVTGVVLSVAINVEVIVVVLDEVAVTSVETAHASDIFSLICVHSSS